MLDQAKTHIYQGNGYKPMSAEALAERFANRPKPQNALTRADLDERIVAVVFDHLLDPDAQPSTTVCRIYITKTFSVMGVSNVLDRDNYDAELGRHYAYQDAYAKLWDYVTLMPR